MALLMTTALTGCSLSGDTSGFKPEPKLSRDEINQQIATLQSNQKIPGGIKAMALKKLNDQLKDAQ
jgi:hypothetical protein